MIAGKDYRNTLSGTSAQPFWACSSSVWRARFTECWTFSKCRCTNIHFQFSTWYLPSANEVCEGYVFTPVCQSFCSQGGMCDGGHAWHGDAYVAGGDMHGKGCMHGGGHAWQGTHTAQTTLPPVIPWDTVNEWAVRILQECILVILVFSLFMFWSFTPVTGFVLVYCINNRQL